MTTLVRQSRTEVFRDYLSERELAERWGVSARTVHRRIAGARLSPVGVEDRLPHFHRRDVEAYEAKQSIAARGGQRRILKSPIFSVCIAHRKGGQSKTSSCFYLARELSAAGKRVVLRDLDVQRSLTKILRALGTSEDEFGRLTFLRRVALVPDGAPLPFKPDIELIDTPPALDDSVPGILRADALIIPLLTEFQGVLALQDMLEYLAATRDKHPALQIIGILPTRFIRRWQPQEGFLQEIRSLGERFGVYVFDPIPESKAVMTFSMTGRLWQPVADRIIQVMMEAPPRG
jgi:cellulose biosynthesis protein BcsQ